MSEDKRRVCGTCAWWAVENVLTGEGNCCYDPVEVRKWAVQWCRHHSLTTGWEEAPKRKDSDYVQFLERLRTGPPLEDDEKKEDGWLPEAIDHPRAVYEGVIKALKERIKEARWLLKAATPAIRSRSFVDAPWCAACEKWLESTDDE